MIMKTREAEKLLIGFCDYVNKKYHVSFLHEYIKKYLRMPEETLTICTECHAEIVSTDDASYCPECRIIEGETMEVTQEEWESL